MKLASRASSFGVWVQQTAARFQCKTKCAKLESALKMSFATVQ